MAPGRGPQRKGREKREGAPTRVHVTETCGSACGHIPTTHVSAPTRISLRRAHGRDCHADTRVTDTRGQALLCGVGRQPCADSTACVCPQMRSRSGHTGSPDTHTRTFVRQLRQPTRGTHSSPREMDPQTGAQRCCAKTRLWKCLAPRWPRPCALSKAPLSRPGPGQTGWTACPSPFTSLLLQSWRHSLPAALYGSPVPYLSMPTISSGDTHCFSTGNTLLPLPYAPLYSYLSGPHYILTGQVYCFSTEDTLPLPPSMAPHHLCLSVPRLCPHCWGTVDTHPPLWVSITRNYLCLIRTPLLGYWRPSAPAASAAAHRCTYLGPLYLHAGTEELSPYHPP